MAFGTVTLESEYSTIPPVSEDRRLFATHRYKIETSLRKTILFSAATISFESLVAGERVLKFGLLPNLRVTRVSDEQARIIISSRKAAKKTVRSTRYFLSAALGKERTINVNMRATRFGRSWRRNFMSAPELPVSNLNGFGEHVLFDLTFKVPKRYTVISVGKLQAESIERDWR